MVCEKCEKKGKLGKVSDTFYALFQIYKCFPLSGDNSRPLEGWGE